MRSARTLILLLGLAVTSLAHAAGGPLGIDHKLHYDNHGIWKRTTQKDLQYAMVLTVVGGSFALGDQNKLGDTFWRSLDAVAISTTSAQVLKWTFQRKRPSQSDSPNQFFKGTQYQSFPSGEVTAISAAVTPFIARYGNDHPAVYALALLPAYDALARMKVHGHWQSDVLAGAALGAGIGIWATRRKSPLIVGWLPGGFSIGFVHRF
jgi:membrane-associated phospholipid phosphatase